jgi:hypothetical protein
MKYFFYFTYYRLYQLGHERDKKAPLFVVVGWMTTMLVANVSAILSLIAICTGVDVGYVLRICTTKLAIGIWMSILGLLVWAGLKVFCVHDKAFCADSIKKYKTNGFKGWWLFAYMIVSFIAMGWLAWIAGARLRMH